MKRLGRILALLLPLAAAAAPAAAQNVCRLARQEGTWSSVGDPANRVIAAQGPLTVLCSNGEELRADSAIIYQATNEVQLFRRVDYQDAGRTLTSDYATYNSQTGRLYATGNVVFTDRQKGSTLRGPELEYFKVMPGRPEAQMTATQRPHVTVRPKSSSNPGQSSRRRDPMEIDADRVITVGDRNMTASGSVVIVDNGTRSTAEEAFYDQVAEHVELRRNAHVNNEKYQLSGDFIASDLQNGSVSKVIAHTGAQLVSDRLTVTGPHLQLFFERDLLQRMISGQLPRPGSGAAQRPAGDSAAAAPRLPGVPVDSAARPAVDSAARELVARPAPPRPAADSVARPAPPRPGTDPGVRPANPVAEGDSAALAAARNDSTTVALPPAQRSVAVAKGFRMEADSLEAILPDQHLRRVNAVGSAKGESWDTVAVRRVQVDSGGQAGVVAPQARPMTEPPTALHEKDLLTGDTIIAFFRDSASAADSARATRPAGGDSVRLAGRPATPPRAAGDTAKTEIERLLAIGNAHSLYRMRDSTNTDSTKKVGLNYLIGDRIDLTFKDGEVDVAHVLGLKQGMFLDPAPPGADSTRADSASAAGRPGSGRATGTGATTTRTAVPAARPPAATRPPAAPPSAPATGTPQRIKPTALVPSAPAAAPSPDGRTVLLSAVRPSPRGGGLALRLELHGDLGFAATREGFAPAGPRPRRARTALTDSQRDVARRGLGAVGNGRIVAYGARSPARSAAEGHAQTAVPSAKCQVPSASVLCGSGGAA